MMRLGLLWYDADVKWPLSRKLEAAATRYAEKFGHAPTVAHIHPQALDGVESPLRLVADHRLGAGYILVGVEETPATGASK